MVRKLKKAIALLIVSIMSAAMLISCGAEKATPEESAKIFLDVLLKDDKTDMNKVGMNEDDYNKFRDSLEYGIMEGFTGTITDSNILTDELKNTLKDNIITGFSKVEYEVVSTKVDGDIARVQFNIKGFDINKISGTVQGRLQADLKANPGMTQQQLLQTSLKYVGEGIAAGEIVQEPKTITVIVTKEGGIWQPGEDDIITIMDAIVS